MAKNSLSTRRAERFVKAMVKQGCTQRRTKSGWIIYFPDGETTMAIHTSTSDNRAVVAMRMKVKRAGLDWPGI